MWTRSRCALLAVLAAAFMAMAVGSAHARDLSIGPSNIFYITWSNFGVWAAGTYSACSVSLSGSFHTRTFPKVTNVLIGHIDEAWMGTCTRGSLTILRETLPWNMRYESFSGTLPRIGEVNVRIIGAGIRAKDGILTSCLARSSETYAYKLRLGLTPEESSFGTVFPVASSIPCGSNWLTPERNDLGEMYDGSVPGRRLRGSLI